MSAIDPTFEKLDASWVSQWGDKLGSTEMAAAIAESERLGKRAMARVAAHCGLDPNIPLLEGEEAALEVFVKDEKKLERLCGLVINGTVLRMAVSQGEYSQLSNAFPDDELRMAVSLRDLHPAQQGLGVDMNKLPSLIESSGKACLLSWKASLSAQAALRLRLMEDATKPIEQPSSKIHPDLANKIVNSVIALLNKEITEIAA